MKNSRYPAHISRLCEIKVLPKVEVLSELVEALPELVEALPELVEALPELVEGWVFL